MLTGFVNFAIECNRNELGASCLFFQMKESMHVYVLMRMIQQRGRDGDDSGDLKESSWGMSFTQTRELPVKQPQLR